MSIARKLYGVRLSPPFRSVTIVMDVLGLDHEQKTILPPKKENLKPEYRALNYQSTIPFLVDIDGFALSESRPIAVYLAQKYDKTGKLYPNDIKMQGLINHRLAFDQGGLYGSWWELFSSLVRRGEKTIQQWQVDQLKFNLDIFEHYVKESKYVAGTDFPTVADFTILASYTSMLESKDTVINFSDYPHAQKWMENVKKEVPNYDVSNGKGLETFAKLLKNHSILNL